MTVRSRDDLERARAKWWATVSSGDLDGYLSLFADDAVWVTPELDEIVGRDAIRAWLAPVFAQFDYELTITVADVRVAGDLGIERARFVSRMTPKPVVPSAPTAPAAPAAPDPFDAPAPLPARGWVPGDDDQPAAGAPAAEDDGEGDGEPGEPGASGEVPSPEPPTGGEPDAGSGEQVAPEPADAPAVGAPSAEAEPAAEPESEPEPEQEPEPDDVEDVEAPLVPAGPDAGDHEPHEGRYLMYWRWHDDAGWLVHRYADVTGVG